MIHLNHIVDVIVDWWYTGNPNLLFDMNNGHIFHRCAFHEHRPDCGVFFVTPSYRPVYDIDNIHVGNIVHGRYREVNR